MGENEMKPKHGLPCGVRLTVGLGGAGGSTALASAAETWTEPEQCDTLCICAVFTSLSVPELSPIEPRDCVPRLAWCCVAGERPAEGRAATTRLRPSLINVPKMAPAEVVAVLCSTDFPARSSAVNSEQVVLTNATHLDRSDARTEALDLAEFFVLVTPNV